MAEYIFNAVIEATRMRLSKHLFSIALLVAFFSAFDASSFFEATSDCHPCLKDAYFSTLLQADKQWLFGNHLLRPVSEKNMTVDAFNGASS